LQNISIALIVIFRKDKTADFNTIESAVKDMLERLKTNIKIYEKDT